MAIAFGSHVLVSGVNGGTSASQDTTGATLLVVCTCSAFGVTATVSDSKTNTWTPLTHFDGHTPHGRMFYVNNPTVGTGHTFTLGPAGVTGVGIFSWWSGAATTSVLDQQNGLSGSPVPAQPGSITPSEDGELVVAGFASVTFTNPLAASGMTIIADQIVIGGQSYALAAAYVVQTTATAINPTWSGMDSSQGANYLASFKAAAGAGPTVGDRIVRPRPLRNVGHPAYLS